MPISIQCPHCGKGFRVADTIEGKTVRCAACATPFEALVLPASPQPTSPPTKPTPAKPAAPQRAPSPSPTIQRPVAPPQPPPLEPLRDDLFDSLPPTGSYQLSSLPPAAPSQKPLSSWGAPASGFGIAPEPNDVPIWKRRLGGLGILVIICPLCIVIPMLEKKYTKHYHPIYYGLFCIVLPLSVVLLLLPPSFMKENSSSLQKGIVLTVWIVGGLLSALALWSFGLG